MAKLQTAVITILSLLVVRRTRNYIFLLLVTLYHEVFCTLAVHHYLKNFKILKKTTFKQAQKLFWKYVVCLHFSTEKDIPVQVLDSCSVLKESSKYPRPVPFFPNTHSQCECRKVFGELKLGTVAILFLFLKLHAVKNKQKKRCTVHLNFV